MRIDKGFISIDYPHFTGKGGVLKLETDRFTFLSSECKWKKKKNIFYTNLSSGVIKGSWKIIVGENSFSSQIENLSSFPWRIKNLSLVFAWDKFSSPLLCRNHLQYINSLFPIFSAGTHTVGRKSFGIPLNAASYTLTLFQNKRTKDSLLIGAGSISEAVTQFEIIPQELHWDSYFGFKINFQFERILKKKISTPSLLFSYGKKPVRLLEEYGEHWKKRYKISSRTKIIGWNSWDYYAGGIREKDVLENSDILRKNIKVRPLYAIIDDGWQSRWGDWEGTNYHFPSGLKGIAKKISQKGLIPGIWLAPYVAHLYSIFVRYNQGCLLRNNEGKLIIKDYSNGPACVLDPAHPKVRDFVYKTFKRLKEHGFKYFKIDFVEPVIEGRNFSDGGGPMRALRKGLQIIRKAVGNDSYLISGQYPLEAGVGLLDAGRIAGDIHNFWSHIKLSAKEISARFWINGTLYNNDPDFLIARCPRTANDIYPYRPYQPRPFDGEDTWLAGKQADITEIITWASIIIMNGGEVILSDNLSRLNNKGWKIIEKVIKNRLSRAAQPLDLFSEEEIPAIWLGKEKNHYLLGVFNWQDEEREIEIDLESIGIKEVKKIEDLWKEKELKLKDIKRINLLPHQSRILKVI